MTDDQTVRYRKAEPNDYTTGSVPECSHPPRRSNGEGLADIERKTTVIIDFRDSPIFQPIAFSITARRLPGYRKLPMQRGRLRHLGFKHATKQRRFTLL